METPLVFHFRFHPFPQNPEPLYRGEYQTPPIKVGFEWKKKLFSYRLRFQSVPCFLLQKPLKPPFTISGENPFLSDSSASGSYNRLLEVDFQSIPLNGYGKTELMKLIQAVLANYGLFGRDIIERIQSRTAADWQEYQQALTDCFMGFDTTGKQQNILALIALGYNEIFRPVVSQYLQKPLAILSAAELAQFAKTRAEIDDRIRGFEYLTQMITSNDSKFSEIGGDVPHDRWGWHINGGVAILSVIAKKVLQDGGFSTVPVMQWAAQNGKIIDHDKNTQTKRIRAGDLGLKTCYLLRLD